MRNKLALFVTLLMIAVVALAQSNPVIETRTTTGQLVAARAKGQRVVMFSCTETSASVGATVKIYHGTSNAGPKLISNITLNANESTRFVFDSATAPLATNGVYIEVTGAATVVIHTWKY